MITRLRLFLFGSVRRQIIVGVAVAHAVLMTLFVVDIVQRQKAAFLDYQLSHALALSLSLATTSANATASHDVMGLQEIIDAQKKFQDLKFATVMDENGKVLAHTDHTRVGQYVRDMPKEPLQKTYSANLLLLDVATPIILMQQHVGWIRIGITQTTVIRELEEITQKGVVYALTTILTGSFMAWVVGRRFTKRLYAIKSAMEEIQAGNPAARSEVSGFDEAADLSAGFNAMLDKLEQQEAERTLMTKELNRSEERAHLFFKRQVVGMAITSPEKGWLQVNDCLCRMLGYSADELSLLTWAEMTHPDDIALDTAQFNRLISGEIDEYNLEKRFFKKDGSVLYTEMSIGCVRSPDDGSVEYVLALLADVTARKRAEASVKAVEEQLQQAQKMESVGRLAGGVAHDFNNMLTIILGHAQLGLMQLEPTHPVVTDFEIISRTAERSADLTRQLLAFARKQTVAPKILDLNATISEMLKMLQRLIGENIQLIWQPAPGLWQIRMDPSQIDQIMANLSVNARDAIEGNGRLTIETKNRVIDADYCAANPEASPGEYVCLTVSDTGSGMDRETLTHIFEPFFTTKALGEGTGLGLATVYGAVKQNNGFINIYSEQGQGTTFSIYLPRYPGEEKQTSLEEIETIIPRGTETILVVEDDMAILNYAKTILEKLGYTVIAEKSPSEAIRLASENAGTIQLLISDVIMPEMNGRELLTALLPISPQLKCLYMSGYTADVIAQHGILRSGVNFIQKPFSMFGFAAKVREVLDGRQ